MEATIGIFEQESDVVEAVRKLRAAGMAPSGLRVIVKNADSIPFILTESDVPIEDMDAIQAAEMKAPASGDRDAATFVPIAVINPYPVGYGYAGTPSLVAGAGVWNDEEAGTATGFLQSIGISEDVAEKCAQAVNEGKYLIVADSDSRASTEALLRRAGAAEIC